MRSPLVAAIVVGVVAVGGAGCKLQAKPCLSTSMSVSPLLHQAAVVRLDVYGGNARCAGSTLAAGAPPPSQSQTVTAGKPLTLDVPAGHHVLLLSAFRDAAATQLVGSACTETDVKANQPACFELKLVEAPDGSVPVFVGEDLAGVTPLDMTLPPASDMAQRPPCSAAPDNCPAGQYCASDGKCAAGCKVDLDCAGTPATPRCLAAAHTCVTCLGNSDCPPGKLCSPSNSCVAGCDPQAPSCPSSEMCCTNLCIDTTMDVLNCGGCGHACSLPNATPKCSGSMCAVKQCTTGFSDCNGSAGDGCECADLGDTNKGCCPTGGCEHGHDGAFNKPFIDCYTKGTYNENVAADAAAAYNPTGKVVKGGCAVPGNQRAACVSAAGECVCFTWSDGAGGVYVGRARRTTGTGTVGCNCANNDSGDVTWN